VRNRYTFNVLKALSVLIVLMLFSCKKRESSVGKEVLNQNDLLGSHQMDTFQLITYSLAEDSVISDNPTYALLGAYSDPVFGSVNANFYTQIRLSALSPNFGDPSKLSVDSVVLSLQYAGIYGELTPQKIAVYQLTEPLSLDSTYYSFSNKTHSGQNLVEQGFETISPNPYGSVVVGKETVSPQLRIRLKNSLGMALITEAMSGGGNFSSDTQFSNFFNGLHVRMENSSLGSGKGGVLYFSLNKPWSKLTIFYTVSGQQKSFDFIINDKCADFNHVDINNAGTSVESALNNSLLGNSEYYAQAFKTRAVVKIPGMKFLPSTTIIHKAQLILPTQYQTGSKYQPPKELNTLIKQGNLFVSVSDVSIYDFSLKQYVIDLRDHLQAIVNKNYTGDELILSPRMFITSSDRVIFNGPNTINKKKPKLIVTYTTF
jgi:hypothetical protein